MDCAGFAVGKLDDEVVGGCLAVSAMSPAVPTILRLTRDSRRR